MSEENKDRADSGEEGKAKPTITIAEKQSGEKESRPTITIAEKNASGDRT